MSRPVRNTAIKALKKSGKQDLPVILQILDATYQYSDVKDIAQLRFLAHFLGGGNQEVETLMQWVGKPKNTPQKLTYEQAKNAMQSFEKAWEIDKKFSNLRPQLATQITEVVRKVSWKPQDIFLLTSHYNNLKNFNQNQADIVNSVKLNLDGWKWFFAARNNIAYITIIPTIILAYFARRIWMRRRLS